MNAIIAHEMETTVDVELRLPERDPRPARAILLHRSRSERLRRAATAFALCWGIAPFTVFIPLMHFILPVTLVLSGIVIGVKRLREDVTLAGVEGACPRCKVHRHFETAGRFVNGRTFFCNGCANSVEIHVVATGV